MVIATGKVGDGDDQRKAIERLLDGAFADHPLDFNVVIAVVAGALGAIVVGIMLETEG